MQQLDLDEAVRAGVLRSDQADALRRFDDRQRHGSGASEERFALVSGFGDVMAAIGLTLCIATGAVASAGWLPLALTIPPLCWWAATFFTARRRMMLSSLVLFAGFALTAAMSALALLLPLAGLSQTAASARHIPDGIAVGIAAVTTLACWRHWRRFHLPLAVAATAVALINVVVCVIRLAFPDLSAGAIEIVLALSGPALFATAMWWDISDVRRETIRSDVAFWLHIAAGYKLVRGAMSLLLGRGGGAVGWGLAFAEVNHRSSGATAALVLALFGLFAAVALVIDRRSLLTSGLFYAVPATRALFGGAQPLVPALFVAGLFLVLLAVRWNPVPAFLLRAVPDTLAAQLPRVRVEAWGPRPVT